MIDRDLAEFYGVGTKRINEQVKRNINRFLQIYDQTDTERKDKLVAICDRYKN